MAFRRLSALWAATSLCLVGATAFPADQKPIGVSDETPGIIPDEIDIKHDPTDKTAKIVLYPGSRTYPDDLRDMGKAMKACSEEDETSVIDLATDVCLSGEYYIRDNIKVLESPSCADGSVPTLMFYENRRCTGSPRKVVDDPKSITERCIWSEQEISVSPYYWSMIYRCETKVEQVVEQQEANPAVLHQNVLGMHGSFREHHGTMFPCHSQFANRSFISTQKTDDCRWSFRRMDRMMETLEIITPAVCSNGTRAQLALYEDIGNDRLNYMCNQGRMTLENGLMDVHDWMLNTCINVSNLKLLRGGFGRALGIMFHCDGIQLDGQTKAKQPSEESYVPRGPRTSHSECATSAGRWQWKDPVRPKTYMYPEPMACMTLPKAHQLRVYDKPTCPDGSHARLATWQEAGCPSWPKRIRTTDTLNCESWNLQSETSYMFWCGAEGLTAEERKKAPEDRRAVISRNQCDPLDLKPGWRVIGKEDGPLVQRVNADTECLSLRKVEQLTLYGNAKCQNGKDAKLAVYKGSACWGKPDRTVDAKKFSDSCKPVCDQGERDRGCSLKFMCNDQ